jgi:hypothetical protein
MHQLEKQLLIGMFAVAGILTLIAANGSFYSFVTDDMDGQPRSGSRDIGADEFSGATILRRPLTTADVGPNVP